MAVRYLFKQWTRHVRRIIGKNDLWRTDTEGVPFSRTIDKIEEAKN